MVSHNAEMEQNIKNSDFFVVFYTQDYFNSALCTVQFEIANSYKKHFVILLKDGIKIDNQFLNSIKGGYKIFKYKKMKKIRRKLLKYMNIVDNDVVLSQPYLQE